TTLLLLEIHPRDRLLRISKEEAQQSQIETTKVLVRGLAHEIKNPLGGIRGAAQLLARELPGDARKDYTNVIIEHADRLRNLVACLHQHSRSAGAGRQSDRSGKPGLHHVGARL